MRIHIPSNETAWEMPKTERKRLRKQGNLRGRTSAYIEQEVTASKGQCAKELMIWKNAQSSRGNPRFDRTRSNMKETRILQKHSPTKSYLRDKTAGQETVKRFSCRRSPAIVDSSANFCHDSCGSGSGDSSDSSLPLPSVCALLARSIILPSILLLITIIANTSARFALAKGQELLLFFFNDMG